MAIGVSCCRRQRRWKSLVTSLEGSLVRWYGKRRETEKEGFEVEIQSGEDESKF